MPPVARRLSAILVAVVVGSGLGMAQPWLATEAHVLNWSACLCDPGGDDQSLLITTFLAWFQALAVVGGALVGLLLFPPAVRRPAANRPVLALAAAAGALAGVPVATAVAPSATTATPVGLPQPDAVRAAAVTGIVLGAAAAWAALRAAPAAASAVLTAGWGWFLAGHSGTHHDGDSTAALGVLDGHSRLPGVAGLFFHLVPVESMALGCGALAWWAARRGASRPAAALGALLGPALVLAAYIGAGLPEQNLQGFEQAAGLFLLSTLACAAGAALGAVRGARPQWILDGLVIALAPAGIVVAGLAGLAPRIYGPAPLRGDLPGALVLMSLVLLPCLLWIAECWAGPAGERQAQPVSLET